MTEPKAPARRPARKSTAISPSQNSVNASLGGIGGGTGLVAIANTVGAHTIAGQILLYIAPAVSVVAGACLYWLRLQVDWYNERWQVARARKILERQLLDSNTSDAHKNRIRQMLEELDQSVAIAQLARVKVFQSPTA